MNRVARILTSLILLLSMAAGSAIHAQEETYKFDLGAGVGMSGYLGDVNQTNMFRNPGFSAQAGFRYLFDTRWAIRAVFTTSGLRGDSSQFSNKFPNADGTGTADFRFTSQIYELTARGEFNFFPYGIGETFKRLKRWTPYLALGVGVCMSASGGSTTVAPTIPMAVGFKFKLRPRLNLALEFCMTKTFGDKFDASLSDLQGIKSDFIKNTDWHSNILLSLTYEFGKRCSTCHYKD